jgi:hypothetical protein
VKETTIANYSRDPFRLPAIRQQRSLTSPQAAPCRFDVNRVLTSADGRQRVGTRCGVSGWLVNGMQEVTELEVTLACCCQPPRGLASIGRHAGSSRPIATAAPSGTGR